VRGLPGLVRDFYREPRAWLALLLTSLVMCYIGGGLMFWFHAVYLGELGPNISWYEHWLLDSTIGFLALTPALAIIMPIASAAALRSRQHRRLVPWLFAAVGGLLFALVATPGPLAHDTFVGRGTWLANRVTELVGDPAAPLAENEEYPLLAELTQQLGFGLVVYTGLMVASLPLLRRLVH
jgi:hypothetical protein